MIKTKEQQKPFIVPERGERIYDRRRGQQERGFVRAKRAARMLANFKATTATQQHKRPSLIHMPAFLSSFIAAVVAATNKSRTIRRADPAVGRNDACPCGATRTFFNVDGEVIEAPEKFKRCCMLRRRSSRVQYGPAQPNDHGNYFWRKGRLSRAIANNAAAVERLMSPITPAALLPATR